jgi:large subunit ribosomal protein L18
MKAIKKLNQKRIRRIARVRAVISGTAVRPRLVVQRSNRYFYAQLVDDTKGNTLVSASSFSLGAAGAKAEKTKKTDNAFAVGELLGKKAVERGIAAAVFDRRSYKFHGRVKSFVEGAKKAGLTI